MSQKEHGSDSRIASLREQNKEYNELYRSWRIEHKQNYGFYFSGPTEELTWRDGEGFVNEYPEASERYAVKRVTSVIAQTLILFSILDIFCTLFFHDKVIFGRYVDYVPAGFFEGDEKISLSLSYLVNIIRRVLPQIYLFSRLKMPIQLIFPMKVSNKPLFHAAIPIAMLSFAVISLLSGVGMSLLSLFGVSSEHTVWIPDNNAYLPAAAILYSIIIPLLSETIHRGVFMQILRQFGDGYALMVTSIIAAFTAPDMQSWIYTFCYSMVIGYFVLRTGSIKTAFIMRLVISISTYWMSFFRITYGSGEMYLTISYAIMAGYIVIGLISLIHLMMKHSGKINLPIFSMYVSQKEKLLVLISEPHVLIWVSIALLSGGVGQVMK